MFLFQLSCTLPSLIWHYEEKISIIVSSVFGTVSSPHVILHTSQQAVLSTPGLQGHPFPFSALALWYGLDPQSSGYLWPSPLSPPSAINSKSSWQDWVRNDGGIGLCISQKLFFLMQQSCPFVWHLKPCEDIAKKAILPEI